MRVSRDLLRDGEIIIANITKSAGKGRKYRHQKCEICSQLGNVLSPTWEHFIPNLGTSRSTNGNLPSVFETTATNELTHDAGGRNLLIADGNEIAQELEQAMGLGILWAVFGN